MNRNIKLGIKNNDDKILSLRNNEDSDKIKNELKKSNKVLIIGGGFIGLEIAASANELGKEVCVIEMNDQLMGKHPKKNFKYIKAHETNGNKIYLNTTIKNIIADKNSYKILLSNDEKLNVDLVIVGIGSIANKLFKDKDIKIDNLLQMNIVKHLKKMFMQLEISDFFQYIIKT